MHHTFTLTGLLKRTPMIKPIHCLAFCSLLACAAEEVERPTTTVKRASGESCLVRGGIAYPGGTPTTYECAAELSCRAVLRGASDNDGVCTNKPTEDEACTREVGCTGSLLCASVADSNSGICARQCKNDNECGSVVSLCMRLGDLPTRVCIR
jgi:hypothetical protein